MTKASPDRGDHSPGACGVAATVIRCGGAGGRPLTNLRARDFKTSSPF